MNGLLAGALRRSAPTDYQIEADTAPNFYLNGNPAPGGTSRADARAGPRPADDPRPVHGTTVNFTNYLADKTEENILHMVTADPKRTPTFTDFANPDLYVQTDVERLVPVGLLERDRSRRVSPVC